MDEKMIKIQLDQDIVRGLLDRLKAGERWVSVANTINDILPSITLTSCLVIAEKLVEGEYVRFPHCYMIELWC